MGAERRGLERMGGVVEYERRAAEEGIRAALTAWDPADS